ncbi:MAG: hypothetical protein KY445_02985 [Armatimonadetes bacterium]|nr:hypothetical protein [Armatimonadota bacterium]
MDDDCWMPGIPRAISDFAQSAQICGAGDALALIDGLDRDRENENHAWEAPLGSVVEYRWNEPVNLAGARLVFDSNLSNSKVMPCSYPQKGGAHRVPASLIKAFRLETCDKNGAWSLAFRADSNRQRLVKVPLQGAVFGLRLVPEATWGAQGARVFAFEPVPELRAAIPAAPQGPHWSEVVARLDEKELPPPENGKETRVEPVFAA